MDHVLANAWVQGGAILFLIVLLLCSNICTFRYIVRPLWKENRKLRDDVMAMNERVVRLGEATRTANENTTRTLAENTAAFTQLMIALGPASLAARLSGGR